MTSSCITSPTSLLLADPVIIPIVTCGDASSLIFIISKGPSIVKLSTEKEKMDHGEQRSSEGAFSVKLMTGEPRRMICRQTCDINLRIDIIDETPCGLLISGEIVKSSTSNAVRGLQSAYANHSTNVQQFWLSQIQLLQPGARIKLLHRGAASDGVISYIHGPDNQRIHFPHVPTEFARPREAIHQRPSSGHAPIRSLPFSLHGNRRTLPYRY